MVSDRGISPPLGNKNPPSDCDPIHGGEGLWRTIFEAVDCGLLVLSEPHQVIVEANGAICQRWQIPREELLGLQLGHVVAASHSKPPDQSASGRILRGPTTGREVEWRLQSIGDARLGTWVAIFAGPTAAAHAADISRQDAITLLPNRQSLEEKLARRLDSPQPFALLFLDLDGFKEINDRHGHLAGDDVLREVGRRLSGSVREHDVVARYGGDEFVVLAEGVATARDAARVARRISAALERPMTIPSEKTRRGEMEVQLGVSIGLGLADRQSSPRALLEKADRDMYRRKRLRRRRRAMHDAASQQN